MQAESGKVYGLDKFKDMLNEVPPNPECDGAKVVMVPTVDDLVAMTGATPVTRAPETMELAEVNKAMIEAGWNRHERRTYLSQKRQGKPTDKVLPFEGLDG